MNFNELMNDKGLKPKEKTEILSNWILENPQRVNELIEFAKSSKDSVKASCVEALEYVTQKKPEIASGECFGFVIRGLTEKAPRVKWESAKVIGNTAHLHTGSLDEAIGNLLDNSCHEGTVVRWSAAWALGQIIKLKTGRNKDLIPAIEAICQREEKNSIKKIYLDALKKVRAR